MFFSCQDHVLQRSLCVALAHALRATPTSSLADRARKQFRRHLLSHGYRADRAHFGGQLEPSSVCLRASGCPALLSCLELAKAESNSGPRPQFPSMARGLRASSTLLRSLQRRLGWFRKNVAAGSQRFGFAGFRRRTPGPPPFSSMNSTPVDCSTIFVLNSNASTLRRWLRLLRFDVLQSDSASSARAVPRLFNAPEETWIMFETVVEPVLF